MLIVRAGCSGRHSREGSPCGVILCLARMRNHLRPLSALLLATGQGFTVAAAAARFGSCPSASLRAGSSPFLSYAGLPAPCSCRLNPI